MVYCGKPSRGCQNCKTRRIKCDEVRPCCTQCKKSNRSCPGYPDEFDLIFRNETLAVKRRAQRAQAASTGKNGKLKSTPKKSGNQNPGVPTSPVTPISPDTPVTPVICESVILYDSKACYGSPSSDCRSDSPDEDSFDGSVSDNIIATPVIPQNASAFIDFSINQDDNNPHRLSPMGFEKKAAQLVDPVLSSSFLWRLSYPKEPTAVGFLIQHHAIRRRHEDSQRGFMELLGSAYERTEPSSLLHKATYALSLGALSNSRQSVSLRLEARREYGKALRELGMVIKNPKLVTTDETLMTILVFSLYEQITCNTVNKDAWLSHVNGAVSLVKLRGKSQFSDPFSRRLFRAVRSMMFIASVTRGQDIEDFPHEQGWRGDDEYEMNNANRLTLISIEIPPIKSKMYSLMAKEKTSATIMEMMHCIKHAQEIDAQLDKWVSSLPDAWNSTIKKVITEEPSNIWSSFFWPGPVYTYQDLNIANVLNDYRVARIFCQSVVLECVVALPATSQSDLMRRAYTRAMYLTRSMINEICWTVPYMLGFDIENSPEGISESIARATKSTGAYFCGMPCWVMLRQPCIPERQRQWVIGRLMYIGRNFGLFGDCKPKS